MATNVYGICGASFSNPSALKSAGFIDFHQVIPGGGSSPDTSFVGTCTSLGVSPILNNGNDGVAGWNGSDSYYATLASDGYMAAGGESEHNAEDQSIMSHMIFMNYGGQGTGGTGGGNNDIFGGGECSGVTGHGCASYLESYTDGSPALISAEAMAQSAASCKDHGCKEVGVMIGGWGVNYGWGASVYIAMADAFSSAGVTCAGFVLWNGEGSDGNATYSSSASIISGLKAQWPPDTRTIKTRFAGGPTPPGPTPTPTPTPPVGTANNVRMNARMRLYQAGYE